MTSYKYTYIQSVAVKITQSKHHHRSSKKRIAHFFSEQKTWQEKSTQPNNVQTKYSTWLEVSEKPLVNMIHLIGKIHV